MSGYEYQGAAEALLSHQSSSGHEVDAEDDPSLGTRVKVADVDALDRFLEALDNELSDEQLEDVAGLATSTGGISGVKGESYHAAKEVLEREEFADPGSDGPRVTGATQDRTVFLSRAAQEVLDRREEREAEQQAAAQRTAAERRRDLARRDGGQPIRRRRRSIHPDREPEYIRQHQVAGLSETQLLIIGIVVVIALAVYTS